MIYTISSHGCISQFLGTPFFQLTDETLDLDMNWVRDFSLNCFGLKYFSPSRLIPKDCAMVSSEILNEKFPINSFSPLNVKENYLVTSSLLPLNFSKKGSHCFYPKIAIRSSWYSELSNVFGSTLLVILTEKLLL